MPESVSSVDAILDGLRERAMIVLADRVVSLDDAVAAVHAAWLAAGRAAATPPDTDLLTELVKLTEIHHNTIRPSKKHDPENQDWRDCPCLTCKRVACVEAVVLAEGRAAATPDPPDMTNMCEGESPDHKPGITPAATPDERLREALALVYVMLTGAEPMWAEMPLDERCARAANEAQQAFLAADREAPDEEAAKCKRCGGSGSLNPRIPGLLNYVRCPDCDGSGSADEPKETTT